MALVADAPKPLWRRRMGPPKPLRVGLRVKPCNHTPSQSSPHVLSPLPTLVRGGIRSDADFAGAAGSPPGSSHSFFHVGASEDTSASGGRDGRCEAAFALTPTSPERRGPRPASGEGKPELTEALRSATAAEGIPEGFRSGLPWKGYRGRRTSDWPLPRPLLNFRGAIPHSAA